MNSNLKNLLLFLALIGVLQSTAFSMDLSGIDVQTIRIGTRGPGDFKSNANYETRLKRDCAARFGSKYEFTGYTGEQHQRAMTMFEVMYLKALQNQIVDYINNNPSAADIQARITAYNQIVGRFTITETTYAMCTSFGPSTKPKRQQEWDQFRLNIEMFLLRNGYYNIKLKILGFFGK